MTSAANSPAAGTAGARRPTLRWRFERARFGRRRFGRGRPLAAVLGVLVFLNAAALLGGATSLAAQPAPPGRAAGGDRTVVHVGPGRQFPVPSAAAKVVGDGTIVDIDAGTYRGDVAVWRQSDLTLRGVGGRVHLDAAGQSAQGKGIWVLQGSNVRVENIEFSGATAVAHNGAGIRAQSHGAVTVTNCFFHDNENGILASNIASSELTVERSEFARNGHGDGYSHNIYVGRIARFTLRFSYMHEARIGHEVKSRAADTFILYNWIGNLSEGTGSYLVDLPDGGTAYLIGNVLQKGRAAENSVAVSFAEESRHNPSRGLFLVNNSFISDLAGVTFIRNRDPAVEARVINDLFAGSGRVLQGRGTLEHSLVDYRGGFRDAAARDYRLVAGSPAIGAGIPPGDGAGRPLMPDAVYVPTAAGRQWHWPTPPDVGALPFSGVPGAKQ